MKLKKITSTSISSGWDDLSHGTIELDETSLDYITGLMTQTYQYSGSVVRELVQNGIESHDKAGNTAPVDVIFDPENKSVTVTDYGTGMSAHELSHTFLRFLTSTKDNDESIVGGHGIGAKSILILDGRAHIVSVKDGKRSTLDMVKDDSGMSYEFYDVDVPCSEPSGFSISSKVSIVEFEQFVSQSTGFLSIMSPGRSQWAYKNYPEDTTPSGSTLNEATWITDNFGYLPKHTCPDFISFTASHGIALVDDFPYILNKDFELVGNRNSYGIIPLVRIPSSEVITYQNRESIESNRRTLAAIHNNVDFESLLKKSVTGADLSTIEGVRAFNRDNRYGFGINHYLYGKACPKNDVVHIDVRGNSKSKLIVTGHDSEKVLIIANNSVKNGAPGGRAFSSLTSNIDPIDSNDIFGKFFLDISSPGKNDVAKKFFQSNSGLKESRIAKKTIASLLSKIEKNKGNLGLSWSIARQALKGSRRNENFFSKDYSVVIVSQHSEEDIRAGNVTIDWDFHLPSGDLSVSLNVKDIVDNNSVDFIDTVQHIEESENLLDNKTEEEIESLLKYSNYNLSSRAFIDGEIKMVSKGSSLPHYYTVVSEEGEIRPEKDVVSLDRDSSVKEFLEKTVSHLSGISTIVVCDDDYVYDEVAVEYGRLAYRSKESHIPRTFFNHYPFSNTTATHRETLGRFDERGSYAFLQFEKGQYALEKNGSPSEGLFDYIKDNLPDGINVISYDDYIKGIDSSMGYTDFHVMSVVCESGITEELLDSITDPKNSVAFPYNEEVVDYIRGFKGFLRKSHNESEAKIMSAGKVPFLLGIRFISDDLEKMMKAHRIYSEALGLPSHSEEECS